MIDLLSENLLQAGLIQFGYFGDGQPYRLNFHLLPASAHMSMYEQQDKAAEVIKDFAHEILTPREAK